MKRPIIYSGMPSFIQFITTPTVDCPGTLLMLQFGKQRYLVGNFVEGSERIRTELNVTRRTVEDIFVTGPARWNNLIGLVSTLMTIAERKAVAVELPDRKNHYPTDLEDYPKSMRLFGPPNLSYFLATLRHFVMKRYLPLDITEVCEDRITETSKGDPQPAFRDQHVEVWAMAISPKRRESEFELTEHNYCKTDTSGSLKRKHSEIDGPDDLAGSGEDAQDHDVGTAKIIAENLFNSNWSPNAYQEVHISEVVMPAKIFIRNASTKVIEPYKGPYPGGELPLPDIKVLIRKQWNNSSSQNISCPSPSHESVSYIIKSRNQRGKFRVEVAEKLGLQRFERGLLVRGHDVTTKNGTKVTPDMVLGDSIQGGGVAVIDLPTVDYVESLLSREELKDDKLMKGVGAFIWILGSGVSMDTRLKQFIEEMPSYKHIISSTDCCPNRLIMSSVSAATIKYSQMDSKRFKVPQFDNTQVPQRSMFVQNPPEKAAGTINVAIPAQIGLRVQIDPNVSIQDNFVHSPLELQKVLEVLHEEVSELGEKARRAVKEDKQAVHSWREQIPSQDAEIITLGTGSAAPAKYRNVSATLVRVPGCGSHLLDCGEGTLGSLQRVYSPDELLEVLRDLRTIWISHQHIDHHLGTVSLISAWHFANHGPVPSLSLDTNKGPFSGSPDLTSTEKRLAVIAEEHYIDFLKEYAEFENYGLDQIMPLVVHAANPLNGTPTLIRWEDTRIPKKDYSRLFGFSSLDAVPVDHCRGAKALVLTFPTGFRVAFSGDCRPSEAFARIGQDTTVLIHEATFAHDRTLDAQRKKHSTTGEALRIGAAMNAKAVVLTHFSQRYSRLPVMDETAGLDLSGMDSSATRLPSIPGNERKENVAVNDAAVEEIVHADEATDVTTAALPEDGEDEDGHRVDDDVGDEGEAGNGIIAEAMEIEAEIEGDKKKGREETRGEEDQKRPDEQEQQEHDRKTEDFNTEYKYSAEDREDSATAPVATADPAPQGHPAPDRAPQISLSVQRIIERKGFRRIRIHDKKFRRPRRMKVCVAFDYMCIRVGDIVEMEKFTPALERLTELPSATYGVVPLQTGPINMQKEMEKGESNKEAGKDMSKGRSEKDDEDDKAGKIEKEKENGKDEHGLGV